MFLDKQPTFITLLLSGKIFQVRDLFLRTQLSCKSDDTSSTYKQTAIFILKQYAEKTFALHFSQHSKQFDFP